ncbi:MAG: outer membrane lipoprotein carrier protein LolA [Gemmatimonadetes bacterium]|nr:outer membrane lipoprotein carrier protein LolA [Gemmatimonadota bacterium]
MVALLPRGRVACAFALVALAPPCAVLAQDAVTVLERAAARYEALDAFCADFRQEIDVTLLRETTRSRGELCQARSDRFEMRFSDPAGDRLVADGAYLWVYFPSMDDGQVVRSTLAAGEGRYDLHHEFLSDPGRRYAAQLDGREIVEGRECYVLAMTPLVPSPYRHAQVWIDRSDFLIRKLVILEESESIRTLELSNVRLNPRLDEARFRFEPPPGVQVIAR